MIKLTDRLKMTIAVDWTLNNKPKQNNVEFSKKIKHSIVNISLPMSTHNICFG